MAKNRSRREVLILIGAVGASWAISQALSSPDAGRLQTPSTTARLLPDYFASARHNSVTRNGRRAMLSSHIYPKATFIRDAFYGPLAMNDIALSAECYQWFARTQDRVTGQIRTAVPFDPADEPLFAPGDDDSTMLFIIWSAWLKRNRVPIDAAAIEKAFAFVQSHVRDDQFVSPAGGFCYWADTVKFDTSERIAHNQGLYVLTLHALRWLGLGQVVDRTITNAQSHYADFFQPDLAALTLGKDSWWNDKLDISALFPEFLLRWLYHQFALPDTSIRSAVDRFRQIASVHRADKSLAGLKVICAADGSFLGRERFLAPELNRPGEYHNGGYWPMYTLTALAMSYRIAPDEALRGLIEQLVEIELAADHTSKEVIILAPSAVGTVDPDRSGYTWNALIVPALKWAGVV
jgi:hypothetical protein